jgi:uncharacterized coiled-coil protein SlyX
MSKERRRFFRIEDVIHLKTETVEQHELDERLREFRNNQHQYSALNEFNYQLDQHQADLKHIKEHLPEVGRYLAIMQKQLDLLTDRLLKEDDDFVDREVEASLSAQGLAFFADESANTGDIVELHLKLMPERHKLVIFARISLDFEHIHEADRELLVKHVHGKQLRALGAARFSEDND